MDFGIASVAAITIIAYLVGALVKASGLNNKWIPILCGVVGGALGAVAKAVGMPDFPAGDYITAVAVSIVSGLAATGVNQCVKQMKSPRKISRSSGGGFCSDFDVTLLLHMECHLAEFAVLRLTPKIEIINSTTAPIAIQRKDTFMPCIKALSP